MAPPRWSRWVVERTTPPQLRPFLLADLDERFAAIAATSPLRARWWYRRQALSALLTQFPSAMGIEGGTSLHGWIDDLRRSARGLARSPLPTIAAVATLGLGIGVVGTAFSILWGTVLRGLPFEEAERLVHFERADRVGGIESLAVTPHDYVAWREAQRSFEDLGAYVEAYAVLPNPGAAPDRYAGVAMSASSFDLLRARPMLGRTFTVEDEVPGASPVVVLSHSLWSSRFGADRALVGSEIVVDGRATTVVGVMPERFGFPIAEQLWTPLRLELSTIDRGSGRLDVFGRLAPGVTIELAREEFDRISSGLAESYPDTNAGVFASLSTFTDEYVGEEFVRSVQFLFVGALLVLLVCCANVANLLLVRGVQRQGALAVQLALGATRGRLVRQLLAEALALACVGSVLGIGLAAYGVAWFDRAGAQAGVLALPHGTDSLFWWDIGLEAPTIGLVVLVTGATAILAGLVPALRVARSTETLRASRFGSRNARTGRFSAALVTGQLALACGLLVTAGLVGKSVMNAGAARATFDAQHVLVARLSLPGSEPSGAGSAYPDHAAQLLFTEALVERLDADPQVLQAAFSSHVPLEPPAAIPFRMEGDPAAASASREVAVVTVSPGYFAAFGLGALEGRTFEASDRANAPPVALANRAFVERWTPGRSPLGLRVQLGNGDAADPWTTIVGVVPDLWDRPGDRAERAGLYVPVAQSGVGDPIVRLGRWGLGYPTFVARLRGEGESTDPMRSAAYAADPGLPVPRVQSMNDVVGQRIGRYSVWARMYVTFAAAALLLAALGVYGVLSFDVTLRRPEIGVRRALGASSVSVQARILRDTGVRVAIGLALGLWLGALMADGIAYALYGVDTRDLGVFAAVGGLLAGIALLASWAPARRAAAVDPVTAIRSE